MRKGLKSITAKNDLEYYCNKTNIPNQNLVGETIEYFETGEGKRAFKPLEFLNLLEKQRQFVIENIQQGEIVISHLKALPLTELEKHILFGLILKWFGGYPVNNLNEDYDKTLKAMQKEFLNYEGETPEKEFCQADTEMRNHMMKLSIAFTTSLNSDIPVTDILNAMPGTSQQAKPYTSFDELFEDATRNGALGEFENQQVYLISRSRYNFEFNVWLQESKSWEYGNESQYQTFLTKDYFIEFLKHEAEQELQRIAKQEKEKASWNITPPQQMNTELSIKISNPVIALFCSIVNDAGILTKGEAENVEDYCKKVCTEFNLPYTDRVRQGFLNSKNQRNIERIMTLILPKIPIEKSNLITNYLDNNKLTKQKLYG